ncbi:EAL domain-containing protein [Sphingomonas xinjiangensis]|uniref:EAL domain-containing protein (Putative c-di-GMP-specific phosphodiesterase class I) n=1 Tax=Sphingomonas xinjiangensis TaxID=643568 RepID=A0A840YPT1_9SPHN|nr:EAL domain-containing protein [Sphingomonas xinjiangensis]MBB5710072.1 EAL domain-containing protein (putative c-di-GMP-specific phosphodiesterase class I) [Sphingomonas xinjiangensis]
MVENATTIAFQPIADTGAGRVYAYEAVLRGADGASMQDIRTPMKAEARVNFDRRCTVAAIRWAIAAGLGTSGARLCIPTFADAITAPNEHLIPALQAARTCGLIPERLIFAIHDYQAVSGPELAEIVHVYGKLGCQTAFVGLGGGQSGLGTCGRYKPDLVKLEPELICGIASSWSRRIVLEDLTPRLRSLGLKAVATGVDCPTVLERLSGFGLHLVQGEAIAKPEAGTLPVPQLRRAA